MMPTRKTVRLKPKINSQIRYSLKLHEHVILFKIKLTKKNQKIFNYLILKYINQNKFNKNI